MKIEIAISPCPNDTYIFHALRNIRGFAPGIETSFVFADVEALNGMALRGEPDVCKLSFHAFAFCQKEYRLLNTGSALGHGCGPLLIRKQKIYPNELRDAHIAIPGKLTTANLLMGISFPEVTHKTEYLFSDIETVVLDGKCDAGLIIHENRFTYEKKGLIKIVDLGEWWENNYQLPIPLGGIAIKRSIPPHVASAVEQAIRSSIMYSHKHQSEALTFCRSLSQEMDKEVLLQHINLYVNDYSLDLGEEGRQAVEFLFKKAIEIQIIPVGIEINKLFL
jgi:1,4-dihydroxy-6-naphthoate synthase